MIYYTKSRKVNSIHQNCCSETNKIGIINIDAIILLYTSLILIPLIKAKR